MFRSHAFFRKSEYDTAARRAFERLPADIPIGAGFVRDGYLMLHEPEKSAVRITAAVLLIDPLQCSQEEERVPGVHAIKQPASGGHRFEIFRMAISLPGVFEISLDYVQNASLIGQPHRKNHTIGMLRPGQALRYRINGKTDFTLSGRMERTYIEYDYVFQHLGAVQEVKLLRPTEREQRKVLPTDYKMVDERKILW